VQNTSYKRCQPKVIGLITLSANWI